MLCYHINASSYYYACVCPHTTTCYDACIGRRGFQEEAKKKRRLPTSSCMCCHTMCVCVSSYDCILLCVYRRTQRPRRLPTNSSQLPRTRRSVCARPSPRALLLRPKLRRKQSKQLARLRKLSLRGVCVCVRVCVQYSLYLLY
jgi:hypothetical protein